MSHGSLLNKHKCRHWYANIIPLFVSQFTYSISPETKFLGFSTHEIMSMHIKHMYLLKKGTIMEMLGTKNTFLSSNTKEIEKNCFHSGIKGIQYFASS